MINQPTKSKVQRSCRFSLDSFQYADDTTIYSSFSAPKLQRCAQQLSPTLNTVSSWSNDSHLALNSKKTKTMLLSTSQMSHVHSLDKKRPAITISDSTLEYVNVSFLVSISTSILIGMSTCKQRARAVTEQYK